MYGCMDVWMYGCMDVWMYGCMDVWMYGCMDVWMYGCMDVCIDGWMDGCMYVSCPKRPCLFTTRTRMLSRAIFLAGNLLACTLGTILRAIKKTLSSPIKSPYVGTGYQMLKKITTHSACRRILDLTPLQSLRRRRYGPHVGNHCIVLILSECLSSPR